MSLTMKFDRGVVLDILKENRTEHAEIVKEATSNYHKKLGAKVTNILVAIEKQPDVPVSPYLDVEPPANHVKAYDTAIKMLEMTVDREITMSSQEYSQYIEDRWSWQERFLNTAAEYSGKAVGKLGLMND